MPVLTNADGRMSMQTKAETDQFFRELDAMGALDGHIPADKVLVMPAPEKVIKGKVLVTGATFFINLCSSPKVHPCLSTSSIVI